LAKGVEFWWGDSKVWSDLGSLTDFVEDRDSVELGCLNEAETDPNLESDLLIESLRSLEDSESEFTELLKLIVPEEEDCEERAPLIAVVIP
jgi:hypothetical protein